jgi:hypothetical protein
MAVNISRLDRFRIASPCPANWEQMSGDDRVRFCDLCNLHVYDISRLSRKEAEAVITNTEGRICARLYRRSDGTIITKDCPVGLRAIRRQVAKVTGAVFVAMLSASVTVFPRARSGSAIQLHSKASLGRDLLAPAAPATWAEVTGTITDPGGAVIEGATITLINSKTNQKQVVKSDKRGHYRLVVSEFGSYTFKVEAPFFHRFEQKLSLHLSDETKLDVELMLGALMGAIVIVEPPRKGYDLDGVHLRINQD